MQTSAAIVIAVASAFAAFHAHAATVERAEVSLSASRCQPALPAFDGAIRKRPLAMQNEGTSGVAFVTCAFDGVADDVPSRKAVSIGIINNAPSVPGTITLTTVSCTLVDAGADFGTPVYLTRSVSFGGGARGPITFTAADNGGQPFVYPAVSCGVPTGFGIQYAGSRFDVETGA